MAGTARSTEHSAPLHAERRTEGALPTPQPVGQGKKGGQLNTFVQHRVCEKRRRSYALATSTTRGRSTGTFPSVPGTLCTSSRLSFMPVAYGRLDTGAAQAFSDLAPSSVVEGVANRTFCARWTDENDFESSMSNVVGNSLLVAAKAVLQHGLRRLRRDLY